MWTDIQKGISQIGYNLGLGGYGISRPVGSAYMPGLTPEAVYNTKSVVENKAPTLQDIAGGSGGASGTWGNTPTNNNSNTNTQNSGQPQNTNSSSQNNNPGFSVPSGPSDEDLNAIYNPIFSNLDAQKSSLESAKLNDLGLIDQSQSDAAAAVANQRTANKGEFDASSQSLAQQRESALQQAVRNYLGLQQQSIARFGGSSSAGQATQELAGQEYYRQSGNTEQTAVAELGKLIRQNTQANLFFDEEENRIRREANVQKSEIAKGYTQALLQIETSRSMAESEKASRKLAEKQRYNDALSAISNQVASNRMALETWKEQQSYLNSQAITKAQEDFTYSLQNGLFPNEQTASIGPSSNTNQQVAYNYNPYGKSREDEINKLLFS